MVASMGFGLGANAEAAERLYFHRDHGRRRIAGIHGFFCLYGIFVRFYDDCFVAREFEGGPDFGAEAGDIASL